MDTPKSAAPDEKTPPPELALATQLSKEKSSPSGPPEISAAVARLASNSIDDLHKLVSELQKMQEFLKSEVDNVQRQIDSAVAGINIIVEAIGPWKASQAHPARATSAPVVDRRSISSNAAGSNGRDAQPERRSRLNFSPWLPSCWRLPAICPGKMRARDFALCKPARRNWHEKGRTLGSAAFKAPALITPDLWSQLLGIDPRSEDLNGASKTAQMDRRRDQVADRTCASEGNGANDS
jgi:hypothetical protein